MADVLRWTGWSWPDGGRCGGSVQAVAGCGVVVRGGAEGLAVCGVVDGARSAETDSGGGGVCEGMGLFTVCEARGGVCGWGWVNL